MSLNVTPLYPEGGISAALVQGFPISTIDPVENQVLAYREATRQWTPVTNVYNLGTAASRNIGQLDGNIPEISPDGTIFLGVPVDGSPGTLNLYDAGSMSYFGISASNNELALKNFNLGSISGNIVRLRDTNLTDDRIFELPDASGTLLISGGALGTPSSGTVTNLTGTASININGTVGATTASTGRFTTLNTSGLVRMGTATTADALSDTLIATSATTQSGLTVQGKPSQSASIFRVVESSNNAANNGWRFDANAVTVAQAGAQRYISPTNEIFPPAFYARWSTVATTPFGAATFSLGPTVAGSKILAVGNGTQFDISGGISVAQIILDKTVTATGTTGAVTINKSSGAVNFAAAASSLVVTNSLVTVNSIIQLTVGTNDTTMRSAIAVAAAGSFTIYPTSAPTAETRVYFTITN